MFGNGEAPPTATISTVTKAAGPILDRLWSRVPRSGGGGLVPTRPVPTTSYPRPARPLMGIFDALKSMPTQTEVTYLVVGVVVGVLGTILVGGAARRSYR